MTKPRICMINGWWICHSTGRAGIGSSPKEAYLFWVESIYPTINTIKLKLPFK